MTFVQFGGGYFGAGTEPAHPEQCCTAALARTLHLERPELRVRVIDFANTLVPDRIAALVLQELAGPASLSTVGFTAAGRRVVPQARLQQAAQYPARPFAWTEDDVILVTGGGKGITAECALSLGQATRARMVLVGSSARSDSELEKTLGKGFDTAGLTYRYVPCDLTQADAVRQLIESVRKELGPITAVVHGAGVNRLRHLDGGGADEVHAEVAPKLLGAHYLTAALADAPPKLCIGLTSIIGVTGMPGNGWYAFANEALDLVLRSFEARHGTAVLSIAFSIWGETGMGFRSGSAERLRQRGIAAIPTAHGVQRFMHLFRCDPGHRQVIVTARAGRLRHLARAPPPRGHRRSRFVEHIIARPGGELKLIARMRLTLQARCLPGRSCPQWLASLSDRVRTGSHGSGDGRLDRRSQPVDCPYRGYPPGASGRRRCVHGDRDRNPRHRRRDGDERRASGARRHSYRTNRLLRRSFCCNDGARHTAAGPMRQGAGWRHGPTHRPADRAVWRPAVSGAALSAHRANLGAG